MELNLSVEYLKKLKMIGQIDPWRRDDDGNPIYALLVPVDTAILEIGGPDTTITRTEFLKCLKDANVFVFRNIDEFVKLRDSLRKVEKEVKTERKKFKREISPERRKALKDHAALIRDKSKGSIP